MVVSTNRQMLTSSQAAELLDVHPSTVKRWCNDGELGFDKTSGGHRRIGLDAAMDFARARRISTVLTPFHPYEPHVWSALSEAEEEGSYRRLLSLAMGWVHRGRLERVGLLLDALGQSDRVSFCGFADGAVRILMNEVGRAWYDGRLRAGEEHMVSQIVTEALLRYRERAIASRPEPTAGIAVVGASEGNQHALGALIVRILLESKGWRVLYLGPDVPLEDFANIQRARGAALVCVSMSPSSAVGDVLRVFGILTEFYDPFRPYTLAVGGAAPEGADASLLAGGPFAEADFFSSCGAFSERLERGWATAPRRENGP